MRLINTPVSYGLVSIILHWSIAILMIGMIPFGWYLTQINYYHPYYHTLFSLHKSFGLLTFFLAVVNVIWYFCTTTPTLPEGTHNSEKIAAHGAHYVLLFMTIVIPLTGYFISTSEGDAVRFFGLFGVPALSAQGHEYQGISGTAHAWFGYGTAALIALHAAAALKHEFINRDGILRRMLGLKPKS